jgi:hypothetical protein
VLLDNSYGTDDSCEELFKNGMQILKRLIYVPEFAESGGSVMITHGGA